MRILPYSVIPIFLGHQGVTGGAELRYLDVYYTEPPVIGFDVICCPEELPPCWLEWRDVNNDHP